jgi:hypothetical protein
MGKIGKRWGKKFVDSRDWLEVNEKGVQQVVYYLDFDWVMNWFSELEEMNFRKVGAKFKFPKSFGVHPCFYTGC